MNLAFALGIVFGLLLSLFSTALAQRSNIATAQTQQSYRSSTQQPNTSPPEQPQHLSSPQGIAKISDRLYRIGNVLIDKDQGCLYLPAAVNMNQGVVELLACGTMGKRHESVLVVDAEPMHIQVGLLLIGLEPGGGLSYQGDPRTPEGDSVWIWVEWKDDDEWRLMRAENLVFDYTRQAPMEPTHWVFSGSQVVEGRFVASIEQSIVTTYHDPYTIIDNPLLGGADDTVYGANKSILPEVGKEMVLIFKRDQKKPTPLHELLQTLKLGKEGVWSR